MKDIKKEYVSYVEYISDRVYYNGSEVDVIIYPPEFEDKYGYRIRVRDKDGEFKIVKIEDMTEAQKQKVREYDFLTYGKSCLKEDRIKNKIISNLSIDKLLKSKGIVVLSSFIMKNTKCRIAKRDEKGNLYKIPVVFMDIEDLELVDRYDIQTFGKSVTKDFYKEELKKVISLYKETKIKGVFDKKIKLDNIEYSVFKNNKIYKIVINKNGEVKVLLNNKLIRKEEQ